MVSNGKTTNRATKDDKFNTHIIYWSQKLSTFLVKLGLQKSCSTPRHTTHTEDSVLLTVGSVETPSSPSALPSKSNFILLEGGSSEGVWGADSSGGAALSSGLAASGGAAFAMLMKACSSFHTFWTDGGKND